MKILEFYPSTNEGIKYNEFDGQIILTNTTPWSDKVGYWDNLQTSLLTSFIDEKYYFTPKKDDVINAVNKIALKNKFNPVKDRIESKVWDGVERAERYFIELLGCADTEYTKEITKLWLTGLVARVYKEGCKFEVVPILRGGQGIGKSTATKRLMPDYHVDTLKTFGKNDNDYRLLESSVVVELGELKGLKKSAIEDVKNFISASEDTYRDVYERRATPHKRHCVFIGTSNAKSFLKDHGTERRFYPLECGVNTPKQHPMEKKEEYFLQVLAEAKAWYDQGGTLNPSARLMEELAEIQEDYKVEDTNKEIIDFLLDEFKIVENWDELSQYEQRQYVLKAMKEPLDDSVKTYLEYPLSNLGIGIQYTNANHLAYLGFNQKPVQGGRNAISQSIRDILDNRDGWEIGKQPKKRRLHKGGTPTTYYRRI